MSQKNKYNVFVKAGFKETQTRDETGKWSKKPGKLEDRPCFKEWFKDSKVVDGSGKPKTFYHGTTHDFNEFSTERGNPENDFGVGFYFSNSIADVEANYDEIGPDLTGRIDKYIDKLENENFAVEMTDEELRRRAEAQLVGNVNKIIPVYLSLQNPIVIGAPVYHAEEKETFFDYSQNYNDETEEFGEETGTLLDVVESVRNTIIEYGDFSSMDYSRVISDIFDNTSDGLSASDLVSIMKSSEGLMYASGENGELIPGEVIRSVFEDLGFDGIIDNTVSDKFGPARRFGQAMSGVYEDTQHVIAFEPGSIKRTDAKSFCHETDIRKSGAIIIDHKAGFKETQQRDASGKWSDSNNNFKKWFKDSKMVDENGDPKVVYHGTNADFDEFDPGFQTVGMLGSGFYFAENIDDVVFRNGTDKQSVLPVFLSIQKPFVIGSEDYFDFVEAEGFMNGFSVNVRGAIIKAKEKGYDAVIAEYHLGNQIIVFDPKKIKSALGNNGDFDPNNPNITKSNILINGQIKAGFRETQRRDQSGKWSKDPWAGMKTYEQEIKKNDFESAGVYDKDGNEIFTKKGASFTVFFSKKERDLMRDAVLTHNHPGMSSFSHADISFLFSTGLTDIRAINSAGDIFSMNKAADYGDIFAKFGRNPIQMINTTFQEATVKLNKLTNQKIMTLAMKEVTGEISSLEMDNIVIKLSQEESHLIWEEVANSEFGQFALKYTKS